MVRKTAFRLVSAAALACVLAACSSETPADNAVASAEPPVIEERQDNFEAIGDAFKLIRGELDKGTPDLAVVAAQANDINARAMRLEGYFPAGTGRDAGHDTEALPAIWEKPEEFAAARQKLIDESAKLASLAEAGDAAAIGPQVMAMGGACKGCHDQFRLAKK
jgi:cytochrome c556